MRLSWMPGVAPPERRVGVRVLGAGVALLCVLCACDTRRTADGPIGECLEFAKAAAPCFGERASARLRASFAVPPKSEAGRAALRAKCIEQRARVRRVCR